MSVKELANRPDVRPVLDNLFPKPDFTLSGSMVAEPHTENYAEIGGAFNYIFSFWMAENHSNAEIARWPSTAGLNQIKSNFSEYETIAETKLDEAETAFAEFLSDGTNKITPELCMSSLDLARIEAAHNGSESRAKALLSSLGEYPDGDIKDLQSLYQTIPETFQEYDSVVVNPDFGPLEVRLGGIDADIACSSTLFDLKTTQSLKLGVRYWRKLVAYATLAEHAISVQSMYPDAACTIPELSEIGLYYSRYGKVWTHSVDDIYSHEQFDEFQDWLIQQF